MEIGDRIRARRKAAGLGLEEAAREAGITKVGLWKIETGRSKSPKLSTVTALAKAMGLKTVDLL